MNWLAGTPLTTVRMSDEQAMRDVQLRGDHAAFSRLILRWEQPIRRLCTRMTGDEHRGEDLTQEAFARVFLRRDQFLAGRKFATWLWRIAINLCYEDARRTGPRKFVSLVDRSIDAPGPDERLVDQESCRMVREALAELPEALRVVVVLREYEGLKFRQIAEVLDTPEGTVKSRMADALQRLGRKLRPGNSFPMSRESEVDCDGTSKR